MNEKKDCRTCVFKFNEMLGTLAPCNMCYNLSEYTPIDEESFMETYWLDDPEVCEQIINEIDIVCEKIEKLEVLLPRKGVMDMCFNGVHHLRGIKQAIISVYLADPRND